jgi:hypothetical protein
VDGPTIAANAIVTVERPASALQLRAAVISNRSDEWLDILDSTGGVLPANVLSQIPPRQLISLATTTPIRVRNPAAAIINVTISADCYVVST